MKRRTIPFHPFLAAAFPILFLYQHNLGRPIEGPRVVFWLVFVLALSSFVWWGLSRLLGDTRRAALLATFVTFALMTYGHVWMAVSEFHRRVTTELLPSSSLLVLVPWVAGVALGCWLLLRVRRGMPELTGFTNTIFVVLVAISLFNIGAAGQAPDMDVRAHAIDISATPPAEPDTLPNVYYIVVDEYARSDILLEHFGHDNEPFLNALEEQGFDVARRSSANYPMTFLSLSSTLNMQYLDALAKSMPEDSPDQRPAARMIEDNEVVRLFKESGYGFVHFNSGYVNTESNRHADHHVQCGLISEFDQILARTTILAVFDQEILHRQTHARVNCILSTLTDVPQMAQEDGRPLFTFAHIVNPHPPYVFDAQGGLVPPRAYDEEGEKQAYIEQVKYLNDRLVEVVSDIVEREETPPVIIIQSDHGTPMLGEWSDPTDVFMQGRLHNLDAILLPGGEDALRDDRTNVNTFRVVLNHVLDLELEELPDRAFFNHPERFYALQDVTDRVLVP